MSAVSEWARVGYRLALAAAVIYAAAIALLMWRQESLLFLPQKLPAAHRFDFGSDVHETWVEVPGARLHALHLQLPRPDGVVFYLHGNAGSLQGWFVDADFYRRANFDLFMIDYRGYGKSSGRIESEAQLHDDVHKAWQVIASRYAGQRRVILGRSLGSGLAATLAAEIQPELTVLVSAYSSMGALAREHYPWVPQAILRYPLRTELALARVQGPVLLAHGERDEVIAPSHSARLATLTPRARLLLVPDAGHNDIQESGAYRDGVAAALKERW